jgi:hypothetical protein
MEKPRPKFSTTAVDKGEVDLIGGFRPEWRTQKRVFTEEWVLSLIFFKFQCLKKLIAYSLSQSLIISMDRSISQTQAPQKEG